MTLRKGAAGLSRRRVILAALGAVVVLPAARFAWLWSRGERMTPNPDPDIAMQGPWILDRADVEGEGEAQ